MTSSYHEAESKAVAAIKKVIPDSLKRSMVQDYSGMFADLYENDAIHPNHYIGCAIDSTGTKVILAEAMEKFDTVGIDCVAMNANDLATLGRVSPFLFMDYIGCQHEVEERGITGEIMKGIVEGLKQSDASGVLRNSIPMNLGKGETASVHELMAGNGLGFDVVGCMLGYVEKKAVKQTVSVGDKIIALPSSGCHSNGFTMIRHTLLNGDFVTNPEFKKLYKGKFSLTDDFEGKTLGDELLTPTRIYVQDMAKVAQDFDVVGVNNTGYGLKNFNRIKGFEFRITNPLGAQPIFGLIQQESGMSDERMYTTFNMGMGFFIVAPNEHAEEILKRVDGQIVGEVSSQVDGPSRTILEKDGSEIVFEGY